MLILFFVYQIIINSLHENTPDSNLNKEVNQSQLYLPLLFFENKQQEEDVASRFIEKNSIHDKLRSSFVGLYKHVNNK
jgi:hypothetical protein